ncbi:ubiquitin carboxyl-terminal hydrolase 35 isoform X2 [Notamacropus eugenii]
MDGVIRNLTNDDSITDAQMMTAISRMIDWVSWPLGKNIDKWIITLLKGLAAVKKFSILIEVSLSKIEKVFSKLLYPIVREAALSVLKYMLLSFQHSHEAFHLLLPHIPKMVASLAEEDSNSRANWLEELAELIHCMVFRFSGFPDLYEPVMEAIKDLHVPNEDRIKQLLGQNAWTSQKNELVCFYPRLAAKSDTGKIGLINLGNTCYMNSVIQALFMASDFRHCVLHLPEDNSQPLMTKLQWLFAFLEHSQRPAVSPESFLSASWTPWFSPGAQQDCSEYLKYLLDRLHEEEKTGKRICQKLKQSNTPSPPEEHPSPSPTAVEKMFGGKIVTRIRCLRCLNVSTREEAFTDLSLAFPPPDRRRRRLGSVMLPVEDVRVHGPLSTAKTQAPGTEGARRQRKHCIAGDALPPVVSIEILGFKEPGRHRDNFRQENEKEKKEKEGNSDKEEEKKEVEEKTQKKEKEKMGEREKKEEEEEEGQKVKEKEKEEKKREENEVKEKEAKEKKEKQKGEEKIEKKEKEKVEKKEEDEKEVEKKEEKEKEVEEKEEKEEVEKKEEKEKDVEKKEKEEVEKKKEKEKEMEEKEKEEVEKKKEKEKVEKKKEKEKEVEEKEEKEKEVEKKKEKEEVEKKKEKEKVEKKEEKEEEVEKKKEKEEVEKKKEKEKEVEEKEEKEKEVEKKKEKEEEVEKKEEEVEEKEEKEEKVEKKKEKEEVEKRKEKEEVEKKEEEEVTKKKKVEQKKEEEKVEKKEEGKEIEKKMKKKTEEKEVKKKKEEKEIEKKEEEGKDMEKKMKKKKEAEQKKEEKVEKKKKEKEEVEKKNEVEKKEEEKVEKNKMEKKEKEAQDKKEGEKEVEKKEDERKETEKKEVKKEKKVEKKEEEKVEKKKKEKEIEKKEKEKEVKEKAEKKKEKKVDENKEKKEEEEREKDEKKKEEERCLGPRTGGNQGVASGEQMCGPEGSRSVPDLLNYFLSPETLTAENRYHCEHCASLQDAEKVVELSEGPRYLILTLLRFSFDLRTMRRKKILDNVSIPLFLRLPMASSCPQQDQTQACAAYDLCSVVVHSGISSESGHYYCYAREGTTATVNLPGSMGLSSAEKATGLESQWYLFNDTRVSFSSFESVSNVTSFFPKDTAYVLFYRQRAREGLRAEPRSPRPHSEPALHKDLIEAISKDNILYLQEQEKEARSRSAYISTLPKSPPWGRDFDEDKDEDDEGSPGGCDPAAGGSGSSFHRLVF